MVAYSSLAIASLFALAATGANAFAPSSTILNTNLRSDTSLDAFAAPTLIIGPMIRKMRAENDKKKMPMASPDEARGEAPGLRVGEQAWKWPPVWPYDPDFFMRSEEIVAPPATGMANTMGGMQGAPAADVAEVEALDQVKFWKSDNGDVNTELDEEAAAQLTR